MTIGSSLVLSAWVLAASAAATGAPSLAAAPVERVQPAYPPEALGAGQEGNVTLKVEIGRKGRVVSVEIASEAPAGFGFGREAAYAVRQSRYAPEIKPGVYALQVLFRLAE
jgi:periplasmic protein TonB